LAIDYGLTLDKILCSPEFAAEFDRLANEFGPADTTPCQYRQAAISIRKRSNAARNAAAEDFGDWLDRKRKLRRVKIEDCLDAEFEIAGVYVLFAGEAAIYVGETTNIRALVEHLLNNSNWLDLEPDLVAVVPNTDSLSRKYALKSALAQRENPPLNCRLLVCDSELPKI
jgi:hypothetical protein